MEPNDNGVRDCGDHWSLPIGGGEVTQVRVDYAFGLVVETYDERSVTCNIRINTTFLYVDDEVRKTMDPDETDKLGSLVNLHKQRVERAAVEKEGRLSIYFVHRRSLHVPPHPRYEAWQVSGTNHGSRGDFELISTPGGDVTTFSGS